MRHGQHWRRCCLTILNLRSWRIISHRANTSRCQNHRRSGTASNTEGMYHDRAFVSVKVVANNKTMQYTNKHPCKAADYLIAPDTACLSEAKNKIRQHGNGEIIPSGTDSPDKGEKGM